MTTAFISLALLLLALPLPAGAVEPYTKTLIGVMPGNRAIKSIDLCSAYGDKIWLTLNSNQVPYSWDLFLNTIEPVAYFDYSLQRLLDKENTDYQAPWTYISSSGDSFVVGNRDGVISVSHDGESVRRRGELGTEGLDDIAFVYEDSDMFVAISSGGNAEDKYDFIADKYITDWYTYSPGSFIQPSIAFPKARNERNLAVYHDKESRASYIACLYTSGADKEITLLKVEDGASSATRIGSFDIASQITSENNHSRICLAVMSDRSGDRLPAILFGEELIFFENQPWSIKLPSPPADADTWAYCLNPPAGFVYVIYSTRKQSGKLLLRTYDLIHLTSGKLV